MTSEGFGFSRKFKMQVVLMVVLPVSAGIICGYFFNVILALTIGAVVAAYCLIFIFNKRRRYIHDVGLFLAALFSVAMWVAFFLRHFCWKG